MDFWRKLNNFFRPEVEVKKFLELIQDQSEALHDQRKKISSLVQDFKEEERWKNQYTNALSILTESMQSMVWQKDIHNRYVLANSQHCERFFGFEGTKECLLNIIGKTDLELIQEIFNKNNIQNTFGEICVLTDSFVKERNKITHFFEKGIVEGIEVLLYVVKIPQFEDDEFIGTMGIGWDFSNKIKSMMNIINKWVKNKEVQIIYEKNDSFCYHVAPEIRQCEMFQHICPLPCKEKFGKVLYNNEDILLYSV